VAIGDHGRVRAVAGHDPLERLADRVERRIREVGLRVGRRIPGGQEERVALALGRRRRARARPAAGRRRRGVRPDGAVAGAGLEFLVIDADGRIRSDYQFIAP
jgi:hypothetical protein